MDHRVSKDMISSGMTPSGQRSQADLGRTQYGSAPSPNSLMDAYKAIYEHHSKDEDGNVIEHEDETLEEGKVNAGLQAYLDKKKGKKGGDDEDHGDEKKGKKGKKGKGGKPDFLDLDKDGDTKEPMKKAAKEKKESFDLVSAYHSIYEKSEPEIVDEENVDEAVVTGSILAGLAAKKALAGLAAKALAKKAVVGATKMAMKKGTTAAASKLVGKVGAKKAAGMVAKKAVTGTGKAMVKNPLNTMVGASMVMPQGGGGGAPAQPKPPKLYSDVDLFDIVRGVLVSEGLDEDTATKVMIELPTLTNEEIIEIEDEVNSMSEQQLNELIAPAVALGARKLASTAAKRGLGTAVKKGAAMAGKALAGKTGVKAVAMGAKKIATKAKPIAKKVGGALLGTTTAGRITRGIGAAALLRKDAYDKGKKAGQGDGSGLTRTTGFYNYDKDF